MNNLFASLQSVLSDTLEKIKLIPSSIGTFINDMRDKIVDKLTIVVSGIVSLPDKIFEGIKFIFVPDSDYLANRIDYLREQVQRIGVASYDMSAILGKETPLEDIKVSIRGKQVTIINMGIVDKVVLKFRSVIRGFMWLMLVFYNYNQFMGVIGQRSMTLGGIISTVSHKEDGA